VPVERNPGEPRAPLTVEERRRIVADIRNVLSPVHLVVSGELADPESVECAREGMRRTLELLARLYDAD
jgi:hypothetical protein